MAIRADRVGVRQDQVDAHGRVISPSFFNELLEDLPEWTDMPVWVNGTEELLPSNNSAPVTSPILADIAYPDIRRDNQYFTYRESPTTVDGLAKIKSIKGNTLVWNQLVNNGNFESVGDWEGLSLTLTVSNNKATLVTSTTSAALVNRTTGVVLPANHKGLLMVKSDNTVPFRVRVYNSAWATLINQSMTKVGNIDYILLNLNDTMNYLYLYPDRSVGDTITVESIQLFDLTQMDMVFDSIVDPSEFTSIFSLPYYDYNQGTLLSFNGNGIKTVGKNLWDNSQLIRGLFNDADFNHSSSQVFASIKWYGFANTTYTVSWGIPVNVVRRIIDGTHSITTQYNNIQTFTLTPSKDGYIGLSFRDSTSSTTQWNTDTTIQIEEGSSATSYEPYISSTTNLPVSTYFPTGMKSAGTVYDELLPTKAITRIGAVDLGTLTYTLSATAGEGSRFSVSANQISNIKPSADNSTIMNAIFLYGKGVSQSNTYNNVQGVSVSSTGVLNIYIEDYKNYTVDQFKTAMSGVYLYYELATPVELPTMSFE